MIPLARCLRFICPPEGQQMTAEIRPTDPATTARSTDRAPTRTALWGTAVHRRPTSTPPHSGTILNRQVNLKCLVDSTSVPWSHDPMASEIACGNVPAWLREDQQAGRKPRLRVGQEATREDQRRAAPR